MWRSFDLITLIRTVVL